MLEVVYRASTEIRHSVVFATVIVALVFLPLFMLGSVEGRLLAAARLRLRRRADRLAGRRADGHAGAVLVAAAELAADRVRRGAASDAAAQSDLRALAGPRCSATGARCCRRGRALLVAALVGIVAAGRSFLPEFNEGALTVSAVTIPGTSLADSNALGQCARAAAAERAGGDIDGAADRARRARRARAGRRVGRDRRAARR